ncbi:hypothetical protein BJ165DRAFT_1495820 [Panaeolus papilionaceus]|nr:hypothetical protein BJ165DRAFT_1495820 [Panaeolus papilionaceus]
MVVLLLAGPTIPVVLCRYHVLKRQVGSLIRKTPAEQRGAPAYLNLDSRSIPNLRLKPTKKTEQAYVEQMSTTSIN